MGQVADSRGDAEAALRLYREAMTGTAEAVRRNPADAQALFEHAQNVFYVGQIAHRRGDFRTAEAYMREYQRLAVRMIALEPDSMKFRMEKQYADTNLAVAFSDQRRFPEAVAQYWEALKTMEAIATADPQNRSYQQSVAESLAWLADAERSVGNYREAIEARRRGIAILERLFAETGDVDYQQRLIPAHRMLGFLYAEQGQTDLAVAQFRAAVDQADSLIPKEPTNTLWREYAYKARLGWAGQLLGAGKMAEAAVQTKAACDGVNSLLRRDARKPEWRVGLTRCWALQSRGALARGNREEAVQYAQAAVRVSKTVRTGDAVADRYLVAAAYRLAGDAERARGNADGAHSNWAIGLAQIPGGAAEPDQIAERATILQRLGRTAEAQQLQARLKAMGYRQRT